MFYKYDSYHISQIAGRQKIADITEDACLTYTDIPLKHHQNSCDFLFNSSIVAKALAERYRAITPEEKERLEVLAKGDKERLDLFILCQCIIIILSTSNVFVYV